MKKLSYLLGVLLVAGMLFTSCSKDDDDDVAGPPTISFKTGAGFTFSDVTINEGETITVGIIATANAVSKKNLDRIVIYAIINNVPQSPIVDTTINVASFNADYNITFPDAFTGKLFAEVTDKDNRKSNVSFDITVDVAAGPIYTYTAILMGGQTNPNAGSFYSTGEDQVYMVGQLTNTPTNQKKIDLVFFYGATNLYTLGAPNNDQVAIAHAANGIETWTEKNATLFGETAVTGLNWADVTDDGLILNHAGNLTKGLANSLTNNQIYAFETAGTSTNPGKKGLFRVVETMGTSGADRAIRIEVKIQQ
jgi:hypothetical protein